MFTFILVSIQQEKALRSEIHFALYHSPGSSLVAKASPDKSLNELRTIISLKLTVATLVKSTITRTSL